MNDDYGHYKERPPISPHLKTVAAGKNQNPTARQQRSKFQPEAPSVIGRGDRSGTLWARRKQLKDSFGTIETSSIYPPDAIIGESYEEIDATDISVF